MSSISEIDRVTNLHKNNELQLLCFKLENNDNLFALNVFKVKEVLKYTGHIISVDGETSSLVDGIVCIRNLNLPLIDLRRWFYYDPLNPKADISSFGVPSKEIVLLVCDFSKFTVAIRIYSPERILGKRWDEIDQGNSVGVNSESGKLISRTKYYDGRIVQVVDVEKMLVDAFPWIEEDKLAELQKLEKMNIDKEILVADDSITVIAMMRKILTKIGVRFKLFRNGRELLDYVFAQDRDIADIGLVITDIEMPVTSGFEVIKQLKNDKRTAHLKIAVNSSMSGKSNEEMAKSLNADEFMSKSNPDEIATILKKYLH